MTTDVLVVEDHRDSAQAIIAALAKAGHRPRHALDGQEALSQLGGAAPDLIVLDLRLPVLDGIGFIDVLRSYLRWQNIPVVVVTAANDDEIDRVTAFGVERIFRKTRFQLDDLVNCVDEILQRKPN